MFGKLLLAGVLQWEREQIDEVIKHQDSYQEIRLRKKNGGIRKIQQPHPVLKRFQRRFLRYFLYRMLNRDWMAHNLYGFMPKKSAADNARRHLRPEMRFVYCIDFKNAFPSVTAKHLKQMFEEVLFEEVETYARVIADRKLAGPKQHFPRPPLFSSRKVRWFRKMFNPPSEYILDHQPDPHVVIHEFIQEVVSLLTYQGRLPQGAPTSPFLLNIIVSRLCILDKIQTTLRDYGIGCTISIFADDIVISGARAIPRPVMIAVYKVISETGIFTVNQKKTRCYKRERGAPLVTGLRLVRYRPTKQQREMVMNGLSKKPWIRVPRPVYETPLFGKTGRVNSVMSVSVPKKTIKKIRGLIYRSIIQPELRPKVEGQIAYLRNIYGHALPNQIQKPYNRYLKSI